MYKYLSLLLLSLTLTQAQDLPYKSQELSTSDMKANNKEITSLAAKEISKSLPQTIDKFTTLISCEAKDTMLIYTYELNVAPKSDEEVKKEGLKRMKESLVYGTCEHSARFLQADITIRYIYKSATTKAELFSLDIDKKSCDIR